MPKPISTHDPRKLFQQAQTLHVKGQLNEAAALYTRLLKQFPNNHQLLACAGLLAMQQNRADDASKLLGQSLQIEPRQPSTLLNLGIALRRLGKQLDALHCYDRAIALKPDYAEAFSNRGNLLKDLQRMEEALASLDRALTLKPDYTEALLNRGEALLLLNRLEDASADLDRAMALKPGQDFLAGSRLHVKAKLCNWCDFQRDLADLTERIRQGQNATQTFALLAMIDAPALHKQAAETIVRNRFSAAATSPRPAGRKGSGRIHLGYYSADFRKHPVGYLTAELFEKHDRGRFELTAFAFGAAKSDDVQQRIEAAFDRFIDINAMDDVEVARLSRELGIDIAIDLGGFTQGARTGIFAARPAPVQVNYLGYASTMGAPFMDYLIADDKVIPPASRQHFTEKIVYLPDCYMSSDTKRAVSREAMTRTDYGLPVNSRVFCCFANSYKILPNVFDRWMKILHRVEGSVLWLLENYATAADNLRREAAQRGIPAERLVFTGRTNNLSEYLAKQQLADLFLDTFPFGAHTTANDALWSGLPVLTCMGESFASRVAASQLATIGLPELITTSLDEYEELAVALATEPERLAAIRTRLEGSRLTMPLFDTVRFARHIEAAYTAMYERQLAGLPPDHIVIPAAKRN